MQRGYRESEESIFCTYAFDALRPVLFAVRECSDYRSRTMPDLEAMEEMAVMVNPAPLKRAGFTIVQKKEMENAR
jgi:hypothetical protein